jgi:hypothetical protein
LAVVLASTLNDLINKVKCPEISSHSVFYYNSEENECRSLWYELASPHPLSFYESQQICDSKNSSLWGLQDGREEYEEVIFKLMKMNITEIWLDGEVVGTCPEGRYTCLEGNLRMHY